MRCPGCNVVVKAGTPACPSCGTELGSEAPVEQNICPQCHGELPKPPGAVCPHCRHDLTGERHARRRSALIAAAVVIAMVIVGWNMLATQREDDRRTDCQIAGIAERHGGYVPDYCDKYRDITGGIPGLGD